MKENIKIYKNKLHFYSVWYRINRIKVSTGTVKSVENTERRKRTIINIVYVGMILGLSYLFLKYAFWLFFPFIFAFFLAAIIQKPVNFLARKTPLKKGLISGLLVLLIVAVLITILIFTGARVASEVRGLVSWAGSKINSLPQLLETIRVKLLSLAGSLPDGLSKSAKEGIEQFFKNTIGSANEVVTDTAPQKAPLFGSLLSKFDFSMLSKPVSGMWNTAKQIPTIAVGVIISIIASCFMTAGYDEIVNFIKRQFSPEKRVALSAAKSIFFSSLLQLLKSYAIIICITFAEMFIGLSVLKLIGVYNSEYLASVSIIVALIDIFPVLGTGTVLVPWAIVSFITGNIGMGIGLLVLYAVITIIRQILEPKLVASHLGLPPIVTIMCMYVGLQLFGFLGIFIMPLLVTMIKLMNDRGILHVWKNKDAEESEIKSEKI